MVLALKNRNNAPATELDLGETWGGGDLAGEIRARILRKMESRRFPEVAQDATLFRVFRVDIVSNLATASYAAFDLSFRNWELSLPICGITTGETDV